ncbi:MAG: hypothetical protein HQK76_09950 [Desulfobacterales bacterium]|nr:hypothetical protein [Desulfobacterales bacterium]
MLFIKNRYILYLLSFILMFFIGCEEKKLQPVKYNFEFICATFGKGVYKTETCGDSWYYLNAEQRGIEAYYKKLYQHPLKKDLVFIAVSRKGLFSIDLKTLQVNSNLAQYKNITSLLFKNNSNNNAEIFFSCEEKGVFKTKDDFSEIVELNDGLIYRDVQILALYNNSIWAGTTNDIFKLSNDKWITLSNGIKNKNIYSIGGDKKNKIFFVGSGPYSGIKGRFEKIPCFYKSMDDGMSWSASDKGIENGSLIYSIALHPQSPERIYIGTSTGIYQSLNSGSSWKKMKNGLSDDIRIVDIKFRKMEDGKYLVFAAGSNGIYVSFDEDEPIWQKKDYGLDKSIVTSMLFMGL